MKSEWSIFALSLVVAVVLLVFGPDMMRKMQSGAQPHAAQAVIDDRWAGAEGLLPHRAKYMIKTISVKSGSQITNVSGSLEYEWHPECSGYVTRYHFDMLYEYYDAPTAEVMSRISSFEHRDRPELDFVTQRFVNGHDNPSSVFKGIADLDDGTVVYATPVGLRLDLPDDVMFPTRHSLSMVQAIKNKTSFFSAGLFDGGEEDGVSFVSSYIDLRKDGAHNSNMQYPDAVNKTALDSPSYPVRMAFYAYDSPEEAPEYEMSAIFHENGVMRNMNIEYDSFAISQELVSLEILDQGCE